MFFCKRVRADDEGWGLTFSWLTGWVAPRGWMEKLFQFRYLIAVRVWIQLHNCKPMPGRLLVPVGCPCTGLTHSLAPLHNLGHKSNSCRRRRGWKGLLSPPVNGGGWWWRWWWWWEWRTGVPPTAPEAAQGILLGGGGGGGCSATGRVTYAKEGQEWVAVALLWRWRIPRGHLDGARWQSGNTSGNRVLPSVTVTKWQ